jgi:hypothetical protein
VGLVAAGFEGVVLAVVVSAGEALVVAASVAAASVEDSVEDSVADVA